MRYEIKGHVVDAVGGGGIGGVRVEAWDKDFRLDDHLGSASTVSDGSFSITFDETAFSDIFFDSRPDLYFKVYSFSELLASTEDSVLWNVKNPYVGITIEVPHPKPPSCDVNVHRRVLGFLNAAHRPEDLMVPPPNEILLLDERVMEVDESLHHDEVPHSHGQTEPEGKRKTDMVLDRELAKRVLRARDDYNPLHGFRHISQLQQIPGFDRAVLDRLIKLFSPRFKGKWEVLYADAN